MKWVWLLLFFLKEVVENSFQISYNMYYIFGGGILLWHLYNVLNVEKKLMIQ